MKKGWFHRNLCWIVILGIIAVVFLVYIGIEQGLALSFAVLSIIISTFFASRSLKLTQDSLELTRKSIRPFLTFYDVTYEPVSVSGNPEIRLLLHNTGALPTGDITLKYELHFNENKRQAWIHGEQNQSPLFPDEKRVSVFQLLPEITDAICDDTNVITKSPLIIKVEYRSKEEYYHTERRYSLPPGLNKFDRTFTFTVIKGRDYWQ